MAKKVNNVQKVHVEAINLFFNTLDRDVHEYITYNDILFYCSQHNYYITDQTLRELVYDAVEYRTHTHPAYGARQPSNTHTQDSINSIRVERRDLHNHCFAVRKVHQNMVENASTVYLNAKDVASSSTSRRYVSLCKYYHVWCDLLEYGCGQSYRMQEKRHDKLLQPVYTMYEYDEIKYGNRSINQKENRQRHDNERHTIGRHHSHDRDHDHVDVKTNSDKNDTSNHRSSERSSAIYVDFNDRDQWLSSIHNHSVDYLAIPRPHSMSVSNSLIHAHAQQHQHQGKHNNQHREAYSLQPGSSKSSRSVLSHTLIHHPQPFTTLFKPLSNNTVRLNAASHQHDMIHDFTVKSYTLPTHADLREIQKYHDTLIGNRGSHDSNGNRKRINWKHENQITAMKEMEKCMTSRSTFQLPHDYATKHIWPVPSKLRDMTYNRLERDNHAISEEHRLNALGLGKAGFGKQRRGTESSESHPRTRIAHSSEFQSVCHKNASLMVSNDKKIPMKVIERDKSNIEQYDIVEREKLDEHMKKLHGGSRFDTTSLLSSDRSVLRETALPVDVITRDILPEQLHQYE